jgi:1-acyl-sn-glycerol-3-phosphate acyltransferase
MARRSAASALSRRLRPARARKRYHRRTRRRVPWLQTLVLAALLPLLSLISRVRVTGRENIPGGGYIAAANHVSILDALFVALGVRRRLRFMAKSELFDGRWGWLLNRLGAFPVQRGVWDAEAFETAATVLGRGRVMSIFPEGGIHTDRVPAKAGIGHIAHLAGATVLPVYLDGTRSLYRPWRWPKVRVVVGVALQVEADAQPSREQSQRTAQRILDAIHDLAGPSRPAMSGRPGGEPLPRVTPGDVALLRQGWDAFTRGDIEAAAEVLHPDVRWYAAGDPEGEGGCHNREDAVAFLRRARADGLTAELLDIRDAGDRLVAVIHTHAPPQWERSPDPHGEIVTVRDGKITEMVIYPTVDDALAAAGVGPPS